MGATLSFSAAIILASLLVKNVLASVAPSDMYSADSKPTSNFEGAKSRLDISLASNAAVSIVMVFSTILFAYAT